MFKQSSLNICDYNFLQYKLADWKKKKKKKKLFAHKGC